MDLTLTWLCRIGVTMQEYSTLEVKRALKKGRINPSDVVKINYVSLVFKSEDDAFDNGVFEQYPGTIY
jgi:hypothetical protein